MAFGAGRVVGDPEEEGWTFRATVNPELAGPAVAAIEAGKTKYTAAKGMPELCAAVAEKFARVNKVAYDPATEILVSSGGKQSLFYAFLALLERGDEVLIPAPGWLSYPELVRIAGGKPRFVKTGSRTGYKLTPAQLEKAVEYLKGELKNYKPLPGTPAAPDKSK